ncbi:uncharacterized protein MKK02DRAFT_33342 [Dioszegia hungarica]|uniref:Uncharacterized protein n=1 Tax=Dioszegia hungarica TaxID=4972 RepID=A0AA38H7W4_9TREE|nr:uncharacterized protein MKK02DRAFT_33342 [Dioszegia hungarica]KAI9636062.1 hypothetical protein MKK02DRAFT_33342 [Dioszegia hungarica]
MALAPGAVPVDSPDPRLQYHGAWRSDPTDPDRLKYDNGTFNACSNNGDYVSLDWTGGDVTIVGATKPKGPKQYYNGFSDTLRNDAVLWASQGLPNGAHHVELRNENVYMQSDEVQAEERLYMDLDYMAYLPLPALDPQLAAPSPAAPGSSAPPAVPSSAAHGSSVTASAASISVSPASSSSSSGSATVRSGTASSGSATIEVLNHAKRSNDLSICDPGGDNDGNSQAGSWPSGSRACFQFSRATRPGTPPRSSALCVDTFDFICSDKESSVIKRISHRPEGVITAIVPRPMGPVRHIPHRGATYPACFGPRARSLEQPYLALDIACPSTTYRPAPRRGPLPVEKSQGSVSALVARFQTAAAHNAATAQREASRRSSSSSATSSLGVPAGDAPRVTSAGGWRKSGGSTTGDTVASGKGDGEVMEVLKDKDGNGPELNGGSGAASAGKTTGTKPGPTGSAATGGPSTPQKAESDRVKAVSTITPKAPSSPSPKTTRTPAPISTAPASTPAKISPTTAKSPRAAPKSTQSSLPSPKTAVTGVMSSKADVPSAKRAGHSQAASSSTASGTSSIVRPDAGEHTTSSATSSRISNTAAPGKGAATSSTTKTTVSRMADSPTASKIPVKSKPSGSDRVADKAAPSTVSTPKPRPTSSIITPKPSTSTRPPSAFKAAKPLTPAMTGPASSRRPVSAFGPTPTTTPLRPQTTGTPFKPTASSLAKARATPSASGDSPVSSTMSLGRPASKRISLGPTPTRQAGRAGSESPGPSSKLSEGKQQKERVSGSSSMSRLMQGTAASRAKTVEGLPGGGGAASLVSPLKGKASTKGKDGVPKSGSARSLVSRQKSPTPASEEVKPIVPAASEAAEPTASPALVAADLTDEKEPEVEEEVKDGEEGEEKLGQSGESGEVETAEAEAVEPGAVEPESTDIARTGPVGDSPIGRIGLAAVHVPTPGGSGPPSEIGQHPSVGPMPGQAEDLSSSAIPPDPAHQLPTPADPTDTLPRGSDGAASGSDTGADGQLPNDTAQEKTESKGGAGDAE